MAYEVTKRIKGREYRYKVERVRDEDSGHTRLRWQYLGRLHDGNVVPARSYPARVTREGIVAAIAQLLQSRDASRVTVAVIAQHAGISTGTFYRHFHDRRTAIDAAIAHLAGNVIRELPSLANVSDSYDVERERLFGWFSALHRAALDGRALRWVLTRTGRDAIPVQVDPASPAGALRRRLATYLRNLDASGAAQIADADTLAAALLRLHLSFVRDLAAAGDASDAPLRWSEVFPVIERAVFPHAVAAA